ncbi:hypothetical protein BDL97_05G012100 [Sphagnum fallax]|nr:hypothetical protein BDL97_05G012100 [Sphagnum fallax]KAH8960722.1 hypothetical protein BDL97_05G012100 [Sphagnum fallax]
MQQVRAKVLNAQKAVHETFFSVKDIFEKHNVVFTIGASLASAAAAWAGYTARQMHQKKVEDRLNSIEHAMATVHNLEEEHVKALTSSIGVSYSACAATAGTTLVIGYGFGFRGGRWFTLRKIQKQQQRLLNPRTPIRLSQVLRGKKPAGETPNSSKVENVSKVLEGAQSA